MGVRMTGMFSGISPKLVDDLIKAEGIPLENAKNLRGLLPWRPLYLITYTPFPLLFLCLKTLLYNSSDPSLFQVNSNNFHFYKSFFI